MKESMQITSNQGNGKVEEIIDTASKYLETFQAESVVNEERSYEVYSPKLTEDCERTIPIFVEPHEKIILSQISQDAEEVEVWAVNKLFNYPIK